MIIDILNRFLKINTISLLGILIGALFGYIHWFFWGCYWGTYPLSSECWVNCCYGSLFFGYVALLIFRNRKQEILQIKEIHFVVFIVVFTIILFIVSNFKEKRYRPIEGFIPDVEDRFFADSLNEESLHFILFYIDDSEICNAMESKLEDLMLNNEQKIIYKVNVSKHPKLIDRYNISGVPSTLIFREGVEERRIMGVISSANLNMIYQRQIKWVR